MFSKGIKSIKPSLYRCADRAGGFFRTAFVNVFTMAMTSQDIDEMEEVSLTGNSLDDENMVFEWSTSESHSLDSSCICYKEVFLRSLFSFERHIDLGYRDGVPELLLRLLCSAMNKDNSNSNTDYIYELVRKKMIDEGEIKQIEGMIQSTTKRKERFTPIWEEENFVATFVICCQELHEKIKKRIEKNRDISQCINFYKTVEYLIKLSEKIEKNTFSQQEKAVFDKECRNLYFLLGLYYYQDNITPDEMQCMPLGEERQGSLLKAKEYFEESQFIEQELNSKSQLQLNAYLKATIQEWNQKRWNMRYLTFSAIMLTNIIDLCGTYEEREDKKTLEDKAKILVKVIKKITPISSSEGRAFLSDLRVNYYLCCILAGEKKIFEGEVKAGLRYIKEGECEIKALKNNSHTFFINYAKCLRLLAHTTGNTPDSLITLKEEFEELERICQKSHFHRDKIGYISLQLVKIKVFSSLKEDVTEMAKTLYTFVSSSTNLDGNALTIFLNEVKNYLLMLVNKESNQSNKPEHYHTKNSELNQKKHIIPLGNHLLMTEDCGTQIKAVEDNFKGHARGALNQHNNSSELPATTASQDFSLLYTQFLSSDNETKKPHPIAEYEANIHGKVSGQAGFRMANMNNLPTESACVYHASEFARTAINRPIHITQNIHSGAYVGNLSADIGNLNFSKKIENEACVESFNILARLGLFSPRDSPTNIRLFIKKAEQYQESLAEETDKDIVEMCEELKQMLITCRKDIKNVTKAQRDEIRNKIKEIEETKKEIDDSSKLRREPSGHKQ